jgi:hypothetical protein
MSLPTHDTLAEARPTCKARLSLMMGPGAHVVSASAATRIQYHQRSRMAGDAAERPSSTRTRHHRRELTVCERMLPCLVAMGATGPGGQSCDA